MKTAILVDGGFFLKRYQSINGFEKDDPPDAVAKNLVSYCSKHISRVNKYRKRYHLPLTELYRIFYYDAEPFDGDSRNPISGKSLNFKNTELYKFRHSLFKELNKKRKIALRLGFLKNSSKAWTIKARHTKDLLSGKKELGELEDDDLDFPLKQKGVDMKVGLDIATLAFKNQVDQIILITGDSDFVPAAKFARREGVDMILDPMLNNIDSSLREHIDGLWSIKNMSKES